MESIERNPVTLTCRARGNPRPIIEWSKEGQPLNVDPHYKVMPSGDLYIREVRTVDHGRYRCRATNRAGGVAASTRLIVTGMKYPRRTRHYKRRIEGCNLLLFFVSSFRTIYSQVDEAAKASTNTIYSDGVVVYFILLSILPAFSEFYNLVLNMV